ncbi:TRAP transporter large permease [Serpentinicella alkaliphila]|uniref:Tripartite ATP-independent transporter DctM subunit n=1 Tax=Serpentinicella alkaliphila TaxID=1734049 RepID=A0A4R2TR19_9FIRM|nr:TRAP transporter large permease [Serpentinicella alkaliphila]QUH27133.1 TRAP transporter large permease [Serpentinicella alkaliphila]TCQ05267.1 tripartite ATP-independent transporter DctM subunit [Serpentinicella alkaliphila]
MHISAVGLGTIVLLMLLFLQVPVFASLLAGSVVYFSLTPNIPTQIIAQRFIAGIESIPLLAIPFFICAGVFMNYSGVTRRVMDFCEIVTGRMTGGLAQVNVLLSTLMGGLSGSNLADAAMQAKMLVPEMEKKGFSKEFSSVVTASSAIITPLIPPGIAMIIYGSIANVSIGRLFIAGIGPGLLLCVSMMILVTIISKKRGYMPTRTTSVKPAEFLSVLRSAALPLFLPVIIIGGIRLGIFTPTEAGSVAIVYSLILGVVYREMKFSHIISGIKETITGTASIMLIVGAASAFAWILTRERIPQQATELIVNMISNKYIFLMAVNLFLIIVGMFIEGNAAMIVLVPLLAPVATTYGINEIQFAMIFIFNMAIGCLTPPMGTLMFVTCGITKCKIKSFIREAIPFYILLFICLMLLTFVPAFSVGIVNLIY